MGGPSQVHSKDQEQSQNKDKDSLLQPPGEGGLAAAEEELQTGPRPGGAGGGGQGGVDKGDGELVVKWRSVKME